MYLRWGDSRKDFPDSNTATHKPTDNNRFRTERRTESSSSTIETTGSRYSSRSFFRPIEETLVIGR